MVDGSEVTVAVDPGKNESGVAWGFGKRLAACGLVSTPSLSGAGRLVVELPDRLECPLADILDVSIAVGGWIHEGRGWSVERVPPREWKGSVKKPISHRRIWEALSPSEKEVVASCAAAGSQGAGDIEKKIHEACRRLAVDGKVTRYSWKLHNVLDAVGLFLWSVSRGYLPCYRNEERSGN